MRRHIIKSNRLTDFEKDNIKEQVIADIQRNEIVALKMNAANNKTKDISKQSSNNCRKIPATKNEWKKLEIDQSLI